LTRKDRWKIVASDLKILRELARRQAEIARDPVMDERRRLWREHNSLRGERPMVLLEADGVRSEFLPDSALRCAEDWARELELGLRLNIFQHEHVRDDSVVDPFLTVNWKVETSGFGVETKFERAEEGEDIHGFRWEAPLKNLTRDFEKLHPQSFSVGREGTLAWKAHLEEVFDGILPVKIRGAFWWTRGITYQAVLLIGLEELMFYPYDDPDGLHRLMAFLRDDHLAFARWLEKEGLLTLNNDNDYTGSGSRGFTTELPQSDWREGDPVRLKDLWVLVESQETVGISPEMFAEFIFPYELDIAKEFGLTYYGCCEPVHDRWDSLEKIPNLRSVSISPWCDQEFMAEALGRDYVFSRKPAPSLISTGRFDEDAVRENLRATLRAARDCTVELVMKDLHTVNNRPERMGRWVGLAREVIAEFC